MHGSNFFALGVNVGKFCEHVQNVLINPVETRINECMGTVLRMLPTSGFELPRRGVECELRREIERMQREIDALQREKDRLMRLAAAGAQIPVLLHELRKPLSNIAAALETNLLVETMATPALLHALLVEARRMATMLDTAGATTRELRTMSTQRIDGDLDSCKVLLAQVTACHGIDLVWQIERMPELPFDTQVLRSLLCNLVANAIEACSNTGDSIEVCALLDGPDFVLQVLDTGVGMTPETLARCMDPFFTTKPDGFGIGLAICRDLVERAGGRFEIVSSEGAGTRVQARLPLTLTSACAG